MILFFYRNIPSLQLFKNGFLTLGTLIIMIIMKNLGISNHNNQWFQRLNLSSPDCQIWIPLI